MKYRIADKHQQHSLRTLRPKLSLREEYLHAHENLKLLGIIPPDEPPAPADESKRRIHENAETSHPSTLGDETTEGEGPSGRPVVGRAAVDRLTGSQGDRKETP